MKKLICLLLALIMVLAVFASCGKVDGGDTDTDSDTEKRTEKRTEKVTEEAEETAEEVTTEEATTEEATTEEETTEEATTEEVTTEEITTEEVTTEEVTTEEATTEEPLVMKEYNLSDFKIVYSGTYLVDIAEKFAEDIKKISGVELDVSEDDGTVYDYEFIIGRADRDISAVCFDHKSFAHAASEGIYCAGGKVQLLGLDRNTIKSSIEYFFDNVLAEAKTTVEMPELGGLCEKINVDLLSIPKKADASQFRMITNNILMHRYTDEWGVSEKTSRIAELVGAYALYDADVIAFQEVDQLWNTEHGLIEEMAALGYTLVPTGNEHSFNPLYYKTSRFNLIESGYVAYTSNNVEGGPYEERWYTFAVLEEKDTGKQLVVTSTHFVAGLAGVEGKYTELYRQESARQLVAFEASMRAKYPDAVVLMAGDYNSGLSSAAHGIMTESLNSARDTAERQVNMKYNTSTNLAQKPGRGNPPSVIDHIFYSKTDKIVAKYYEVVVSKYSYLYADHVPVLFDFEIK